jgi:hypothetical protein
MASTSSTTSPHRRTRRRRPRGSLPGPSRLQRPLLLQGGEGSYNASPRQGSRRLEGIYPRPSSGVLRGDALGTAVIVLLNTAFIVAHFWRRRVGAPVIIWGGVDNLVDTFVVVDGGRDFICRSCLLALARAWTCTAPFGHRVLQHKCIRCILRHWRGEVVARRQSWQSRTSWYPRVKVRADSKPIRLDRPFPGLSGHYRCASRINPDQRRVHNHFLWGRGGYGAFYLNWLVHGCFLAKSDLPDGFFTSTNEKRGAGSQGTILVPTRPHLRSRI